jgi:hypothetical protein
MWAVAFLQQVYSVRYVLRSAVIVIEKLLLLFQRKINYTFETLGHGVTYWLRRCATSRKVHGTISGRVTEDFFRGIRQVHVPGVDSAFRNEYQDISGGKDGRCVGLTTLPP